MDQWRKTFGDQLCMKCLGSNPFWVADNAIWKLVMSEMEDAILCPSCFITVAEHTFKDRLWRLTLVDD